MDYYQFDRLEKKGKTRKEIELLLEKAPRTVAGLSADLDLDRTSILYHLKQMKVVKKRASGFMWYGLPKKQRGAT